MPTPQPQSVTEQNKQVVLRWFDEVWNQGRRETIAELMAPAGKLHDGATTFTGPAEFEQFFDALRAEMSDFKVTPIISLSEGDLTCLHWSISCRHKASGKTVQLTGTSVARIENGQFVEAWQNWDAAALAAQIAG